MIRKTQSALLAPPEEAASARQQNHFALAFRTLFFVFHTQLLISQSSSDNTNSNRSDTGNAGLHPVTGNHPAHPGRGAGQDNVTLFQRKDA